MNTSDEGFYILIDGQSHGPYGPEELQAGLRAGWARPDHLVWGAGLGGWTPLAQVPGLGGGPNPAPPPGPSASPPVSGSPAPPPRRRFLWLWVGCLALAGLAILAGAVGGAFWLGWLPNPLASDPRPEPYDPDEIYRVDSGDWRNYPDRPAEQAAIAARQRELTRALRTGDPDTAAAFVFPEDQAVIKARFQAEPSLQTALADALDTAEMTFLGAQPDIPDDPRSRTAAFLVTSGGRSFEIVWIKWNGTWFLYRF